MASILNYLYLPSETTEVELRHVRRINRVALWACVAHLPLFLLVAYLCDTSMVQAIGFGTLLVAGPVIANMTLNNPRQLSMIFGFTSMGLGALLVHLGQGPMQIEMHFHFFAALALLTVWGNPLVIWTATLTVALHHALFWLLLPRSVFNYEASFVVVLVHATFVVVESIAASFIARNFFDNVIGLERIVEAKTAEVRTRNAEMGLILDNAEEGFLTVGLNGVMADERSTIIAEWFGPAAAGTAYLWDYVRADNVAQNVLLKLGWQQLVEDIFPFAIAADQLPQRLTRNGRHLALKYKAVLDAEGKLFRVLVMISDVTSLTEAAQRELEQTEMIAAFQKFASDRSGFQQFFHDAKTLVKQIAQRSLPSRNLDFRDVHTLKGNAAQFGLLSVASHCHQLENDLAESERVLSHDERAAIASTWNTTAQRLKDFIQTDHNADITVSNSEYQDMLERLRAINSAGTLVERLKAWSKEPVRSQFKRLGDQVESLGEALASAA